MDSAKRREGERGKSLVICVSKYASGIYLNKKWLRCRVGVALFFEKLKKETNVLRNKFFWAAGRRPKECIYLQYVFSEFIVRLRIHATNKAVNFNLPKMLCAHIHNHNSSSSSEKFVMRDKCRD